MLMHNRQKYLIWLGCTLCLVCPCAEFRRRWHLANFGHRLVTSRDAVHVVDRVGADG